MTAAGDNWPVSARLCGGRADGPVIRSGSYTTAWDATRDRNGTTGKEIAYYLLSTKPSTERFGQGVPPRWGIENSLRWGRMCDRRDAFLGLTKARAKPRHWYTPPLP